MWYKNCMITFKMNCYRLLKTNQSLIHKNNNNNNNLTSSILNVATHSKSTSGDNDKRPEVLLVRSHSIFNVNLQSWFADMKVGPQELFVSSPAQFFPCVTWRNGLRWLAQTPTWSWTNLTTSNQNWQGKEGFLRLSWRNWRRSRNHARSADKHRHWEQQTDDGWSAEKATLCNVNMCAPKQKTDLS